MKKKFKFAGLSLMTLATLPIYSTYSHAETVKTTTIIENKDIPNVKRIDFMSFDANHDGILSMREVGDVLFDSFDKDSNGAIDNKEYDTPSVYTVIPMEATKLTYTDYNSDGIDEKITMSKEEFLERSNLMRFDKDMDGLSPRDFMGSEIKAMDINHNNLIEKDEWGCAYAAKVQPKVNLSKRYNH